jgi:hypothetical protein
MSGIQKLYADLEELLQTGWENPRVVNNKIQKKLLEIEKYKLERDLEIKTLAETIERQKAVLSEANALAIAWTTVCGMRARGRGRRSDVPNVFRAAERFPRRLA